MNARRNWLGACLVLFGVGVHGSASAQASNGAQMENPGGYTVADIYMDLRRQVLALTPQSAASPATNVVAVLMETGYPEAVATLVAVSDGSVSLYFSNGGGIIGAGEHAPVRKVAAKFLAAAAAYVPQSSLAQQFPLPSPGRVRFYLVTPKGTYSAEAAEDDLGYERHSFAPLFHQGHELITAVREHTPQ
jgi:hypothetical protein